MRTNLVSLACIGVAALSGCLSGCKKDEKPRAGEPVAAAASATAPSRSAAPSNTAERAAKAPAPAEGPALIPDTAQPNKTYGIVELAEAYRAWSWADKQIALAGFCKVFGEGTLGDCRYIGAAPGEDALAVSFEAGVDASVKLTDSTPVVLRCTVADWKMDANKLEACSLVSHGSMPPLDEAATPWGASADRPVPVATLIARYDAWAGKEVSVSGHYLSHTTSTNTHGTTIRVDLAAAAGQPALIACNTAEAPADSIVGKRDGVIVKGTIAKAAFGQEELLLESCRLTNR